MILLNKVRIHKETRAAKRKMSFASGLVVGSSFFRARAPRRPATASLRRASSRALSSPRPVLGIDGDDSVEVDWDTDGVDDAIESLRSACARVLSIETRMEARSKALMIETLRVLPEDLEATEISPYGDDEV